MRPMVDMKELPAWAEIHTHNFGEPFKMPRRAWSKWPDVSAGMPAATEASTLHLFHAIMFPGWGRTAIPSFS